ncbi:porin family protein [Flavobacterium flavipallidum]|uniref:Porin family protein n=1 Tax=Flavobacterium flavipallidum TaxID=3139140 RepID=A0ABU9HNX8_9FLAO
MRNLLAAAILCFSFANFTNAQSLEPSVGIKGGLNFSNLYTDDVDDNNMLTSFNAGLYLNLPISTAASIQPEFNFSRKGSELVYDNAFATGTTRLKLNYLEMPVLLKLNVTPNFNIHFGPYAAYLIDGKATNETNNGSFNFEENISNDDLNKWDYGLSGGIGFDFASTSLGIRYNYGLQTIGKEKTFNGSTYTFPDSKNSSLSLYVGFKL